MANPKSERMNTGDGGEIAPEVMERSAAGDVVGEIAGHTPKDAMGFFVKCIGIGLILLCVGAGVSFVLYGGIFFKASAAAQVNNGGEDKGLPPRLDIRKEITHNTGIEGNTGGINQTIVVTPPVLKKD